MDITTLPDDTQSPVQEGETTEGGDTTTSAGESSGETHQNGVQEEADAVVSD